jgi:imidazolonepropionase-like amidohydrolase
MVAAAPRTTKRNIVTLTRPSGESVLTVAADGSATNAYEERENGRGSRVDATWRLNADGTLASFDATGHENVGLPLEEHFSYDGKHAKWKSKAESGEKDVTGPAFYVPLAPTVEVYGLLTKALLKNGGTLPLLPDGEARIEKTTTVTAKSGDKTARVTGYAIKGLDLLPTRVWMDENGEFFGYTDPWYSCVMEGFEAAIPDLVAEQKKLDEAREDELAKRLTHKPPAAGLAITHARVLAWDGPDKAHWLADTTVIVKDGKISALGASKATKIDPAMETIDAQGKALIPGLWDVHSHLGPADGVLDVASGVTTARDVGNDPDRLDEFKARFESGAAVGPRVMRAGFIEGRGEKAAGSKITAENEDEAKAAVEFYKKRGYDQIKIYNSMKPELVPILAKAAHEAGMRVSGHVPVHMRAEEAVRAGYDEINHVNMLFLNFFIDHDTDTRTPLRFSIVAERAPDLDLNGKAAQDFFALLIAKKTTVDPTLGVFENLFVDRVGELGPGAKPIAARMPVQVRRNWLRGGIPVPEGKDARYKESFQRTLAMVKALHDHKIPIATGTDSLAGVMLHREIELYVAAGLTPAAALQAASLTPARIMKREKTSGAIGVGKDADMVLIDGDPLAHIEDVRKVVTTIKQGNTFASDALYAEVGIKPWK